MDTYYEVEAELEAELLAELDARRIQGAYYRKAILEFGEDVTWLPLGRIAAYQNGKAHERLVSEDGDIPLVTARFISRNGDANRFVSQRDVQTSARTGDTALVLSDLPNGRALARTFFVDRDDSYAINQRVARIRVIDPAQVDAKFLCQVLNRNPGLLTHDNGVDQTHLSKGQVVDLMIPVPAIDEQRRIAAILDRLNELMTELAEALPDELQARHQQYEYYRTKLLAFEESIA